MRKLRLGAFVCALLLCVSLATLPVVAATDATGSASDAAEWLKATCPAPGLGDEPVVLALLRGGYVTPQQDYTKGYIQQVLAHLQASGAAQQTLMESALQAQVLAASGLSLEEYAPDLLRVFANTDAFSLADLSTQCTILLLFASNSPALPPAPPLDTDEAASTLAARANEDGGFGDNTSNALDTARALEVLSLYKDADGCADAALKAGVWLQLRANDMGGFDVDGRFSVEATAHAALASAARGGDPELLEHESASLLRALFAFQTESGGFATNPDSDPDIQLTALCLMSMAAKNRYDRKQPSIFNYSDVSPLQWTALAQGTTSGADIGSITGTGSQANPFAIFLAVSVVAIVVVILVVVLLVSSHRGSQPSQRRR